MRGGERRLSPGKLLQSGTEPQQSSGNAPHNELLRRGKRGFRTPVYYMTLRSERRSTPLLRR